MVEATQIHARINRFYKNGWCHKLSALVIATAYFILLIFINNSTYFWATLALVFILFVTTFSCASPDSPLLLRLRGARVREIRNRTGVQLDEEGGEERASTPETRIWMTDVPPSYSIVMADLGPPTPPPSYGSAILMFPPPYSEKLQAGQETPRRLRPLSISTQVSVCNSVPGTPQPGLTISTQISLLDAAAVRGRLFLSRQVSREELDVFTETLQLRTSLFLSRQASREDLPDSEELQPIDIRGPFVFMADQSTSTSTNNQQPEEKKEN